MDAPWPLPSDLIGVLLSFLRTPDKFRLALGGKKFFTLVTSMIQAIDFSMEITPRLPHLPQLRSLGLPCIADQEWPLYRNLFNQSCWSSLEKLAIYNDISGTEVARALFDPASTELRFDSFPNLIYLSITISCPGFDISLRRFPRLEELDIAAPAERFFDSLVRPDCSRLQYLALQNGTPVEQLLRLKEAHLSRLDHLLLMGYYIEDRIEDCLTTAFNTFLLPRYESKEQWLAALDYYFATLDRVSPLGPKLMIANCNFIASAFHCNFPVLEDVLARLRKRGLYVDPANGLITNSEPFCELFFHNSISNTNILLAHGLDIGYARPQSDSLILDKLPVTSVESFKFIFEEKNIIKDNASMTIFEYARSLHPNYPFFWDLPLFSFVLYQMSRVGNPSVELLEYLLANRTRIISILGSEAAFGGPTSVTLRGGTPAVHYVDNVNVMRFLQEHGADPWAVDSDGNTIISALLLDNASVDLKQLLDYLLKQPSFNPKWLNKKGESHVDCGLKIGKMVPKQLIDSLLDLGVALTEHTAEILGSAVVIPSTVRVLDRLSNDQIRTVIVKWCSVWWHMDELSTTVAPYLFSTAISRGIDLASIELAILNDLSLGVNRTLLSFCNDISGSQDNLNKLLSHSRASQLRRTIFGLWKNQPNTLKSFSTNFQFYINEILHRENF